jgi:hypothetical protein
MEKSITSKSKEGKKKLPTGAKVLGTETRVSVREISNGFVVSKHVETRYQAPGKDYSDWIDDTVEIYSKVDPLEIKIDGKNLADSFE